MLNFQKPEESRVEVLHRHQSANVRLGLSKRNVGVILTILLTLDILFAASHLLGTLPEANKFSLANWLGLLDLSAENTIPGTYLTLKLIAGSCLAGLVIFSFEPEEKISTFWYAAVLILIYLALDRMTQLHAVWAGDIAINIFGATAATPHHAHLLSQGLPTAIFYFSAMLAFHRQYRRVLRWVIPSASLLMLPYISPDFGALIRDMSMNSFLSSFVKPFSQQDFITTGKNGIYLLNSTLIFAILLVALHEMQKQTVTYTWYDVE